MENNLNNQDGENENGIKSEKTYKLPGIKKPVSKLTLIRIICIAAASFVAVLALTLGLVFGLRNNGSPNEYSVIFEACDHALYNSDLFEGGSAASGTVTVRGGQEISFSVTVEDGYTQTPRVTANNAVISPLRGAYGFTVNEDTVIRVSEIFEVAVSLSGAGTEQSPFIITNARELNYVAQRVNEGAATFVQAYYALGNDINCNGAALNVIGNGRTQASLFGGYFDGRGYTISNYVMNTRDITYVGLFGYVQSSGTGTDNLGTIINLNLKDFTVNAFASDSNNVVAGAFIGYGMASNLISCSAENGAINIFGGNFFSYVGGAVGIQQSAWATTIGGALFPFFNTVSSVYTDVDIAVGSGYVIAAGGITGYVYSDTETAISMISNSYSTGNVLGALRAGGIAGFLGNYSSVANSYSTGNIEAYSSIADNGNGSDYNAYAGGIVGYTGVNSVISNSFSLSDTYASAVAGSEYCNADGIVGHKEDGGIVAADVAVFNSEHLDAIPTADYITNTLNWKDSDWSVTGGSLPTLTNGNTTSTITFTAGFTDGQTVDGGSNDSISIEIENGRYYPISNYFNAENSIQRVYSSDDEYTSYGYYFDADKNLKVPFGYIITGDVTLYVGFADYSAVEGTYYLENNDRTIRLELNGDGEYLYYDARNHASAFSYDGENILFYDALFARLSNVIVEDAPNQNYESRHFVGKITDGGLEVYDGIYFPENNKLTFTSTEPAAKNPFAGVWQKSATVAKTYTFDNDNNWSYNYNGTSYSGTYTRDTEHNTATLSLGSGTPYATVGFDNSGLLAVTLDGADEAELYCLQGSLFGVWYDSSANGYLRFDGYDNSFSGELVANIDGAPQQLVYVKDGFFDAYLEGQLTGAMQNAQIFTLLYYDTLELFGYVIYSPVTNVLNGVIYSTANGGFVSDYSFYLIDNYSGEWIGNGDSGVIIMNFNGLGIYEATFEGVTENLGYVEINGQRVEYKVDIENGLAGTFTYNGVDYTLTFNDNDNSVNISAANGDTDLKRMDALYEYTLVDNANNRYTFNGGDTVSAGVLTVYYYDEISDSHSSEETFGYSITSGTVADKDLQVALTQNSASVGTITISNDAFLFEANGRSAQLEMFTPFTGSWAMSTGTIVDARTIFTIGTFNLSNTAVGNFQDMEQATYTYNREAGYVLINYITESSPQASPIYLFQYEDGIAISSYPYLVQGDFIYACARDEFYGAWISTETSSHTIRFDGLADSRYTYGIAYDNLSDITYRYTRRFGKIYLWVYNDDTAVSVFNSAMGMTGEYVFGNGTRTRYELVEFDEETTPVCSVVNNNVRYDFFFDGSIEIDGKYGTYELDEVNGNVTRLVIHMAGEDDRTAEVNHAEQTIEFIA